MFDLIIRDGLIIDGTNKGCFGPIDIGIEKTRITALGQLKEVPSKRTIQAEGRYVAPGFVDIHSHSDLSLLVLPPPESKIAQGVTTEVIGNCGLSAAPCLGVSRTKIERRCREYGLELSWKSLREYLGLLEERGLVSNIVPLIGQGNIRGSVIGYDDRPATTEELNKMKGLWTSSIEEGGAFGLSAGLAYPPGCYTKIDELIELGQGLEQVDGVYTFHLRSEGEALIEAVREVLRIGEETGVKVHISHFKASQANRTRLLIALQMIEEAIARGTRVSCDLYPYLAANTDLDVILPSWAWEGGTQKELLRLNDPGMRRRMRLKILSSHPGDDYWERIVISRVSREENRWMEGKSLAEIARGGDVLEFLFDLLIKEELKIEANFFFGDEENLKEILKRPWTMIGSDASARSKGGILSKGRPHPRTFGSFARTLSMYVQKEKVLSLEEAIYKMTGLPASLLGLTDRGGVRTGFFADLVIFSPSRIEDLATYEDPFQYPLGIDYTIVNGRIVWEKEAWTGQRPGKVLRK